MNMHTSSRLRKILVVCGFVVLSNFAVGCSGCGDREVQGRLDKTLDAIRRNSSDDNEKINALQQATPETLKTPKIVWVRLYTQPARVSFWLYWIEKSPTPDAILLRNDATGYSKTLPFNELYFQENKMEAKEGVLFRFVRTVELQSGESEAGNDLKELEKQLSEGEVEAVLIRDGKPVSAACIVELRSKEATSAPGK